MQSHLSQMTENTRTLVAINSKQNFDFSLAYHYICQKHFMIQRIQTLFLLAAAGLLTSMVFTPMIKFTDGETVIRYIEFTPTLIMLIVTVVLSFVNIF